MTNPKNHPDPKAHFFTELFDYGHQVNQELIRAMQRHSDKVPQKGMALINHVLNAHQIWNNRIKRTASPFAVWERHDIQQLSEIDKRNYSDTLSILEDADLDQVLTYSNSQNKTFRNSVQHILFHVVNHSTYHRGQIALLFRQEGLEPLNTDYILFKR